MRKIIYFVSCLVFFSCQKEQQTPKQQTKNLNKKVNEIKQDDTAAPPEIADEDKVKKWLEISIKNCYKNFNGEYSKICTKRCMEYIQDTYSIDFGNEPITIEEFKKKWKGVYDTNKAVINGADILTCSQDPYNITAKAKFIKRIDPNTFIFEVETLYDGKFYNCFRTVKVIKHNSSFLIDEISL
ncbi:hypothetical protein CYV15_07865 [Riemerella anatipestifer]|uniref:hypothetical protein n=1 Tax=Riemerella anatipestifer TaxID=34085 RepID=UPI000D13EF35|nr:hypothetical protein [Riemerella anatipestifer]MDD1525278.1 hypothetical protein [Riemerella anatipestifer]MDY3318875.1 hypothetical protein [Riemerella anatipestifer]MDY3325146.1 hypothetical protein [Riemerella anatipestifer]MDY3352865.1 hypothetical protein [Riemerella anatipestifer]PST43714.1 hypothetical protein CYV15_07865 [Riemerella anatipestifer]